MIILDKEKISKFITGYAGIKHSQLMLLDEYPMKTGWKKRLIGKVITEREFDLLVKSKGVNLDNRQLSALQDDRNLFLDMYDYLLEKNMSPLAKLKNPLDAKRQVYLMMLSNHSMFKIGQSLQPLKRMRFLSASWGELDYEKSLVIHGIHSGIELESTLHFLLMKWNINFEPHEIKGDGRTEWFKPAAYDIALKEIDRICHIQGIKRDIIPIADLPD